MCVFQGLVLGVYEKDKDNSKVFLTEAAAAFDRSISGKLSEILSVWVDHSIPVFIFIAQFNNTHCDQASVQKSGCRFKCIPDEQREVTVTTRGRNRSQMRASYTAIINLFFSFSYTSVILSCHTFLNVLKGCSVLNVIVFLITAAHWLWAGYHFWSLLSRSGPPLKKGKSRIFYGLHQVSMKCVVVLMHDSVLVDAMPPW